MRCIDHVRAHWLLAGLLLTTCGTSLAAGAEVTDPARLLPSDAVGYVSLRDPGVLVDAVNQPSYYEPLLSISQVEKAIHSSGFKKFQQVLALLELQLGTSWQSAVKQLAGNGITASYDPSTKGIIVIVQGSDDALLQKLHDTVVQLIEADASNRGKKSPVESKEHAGVRGWTFGKGECHAIVGSSLIISDKNDTLKAVLDRLADASAKGLAGNAQFQKVRSQCESGSLAWSMVDLSAFRKLPGFKDALTKKSNNPLIEILAGGVLDAARSAPYAAASLRVEGSKVKLKAELPRDADQIASTRKWEFSPDTAAGAPVPLVPKQALANLAFYRDFAGMWQAREELFDEKVNAGFTQADTGLGLYFSGRDFGPEVLAKLSPRWQFIAARHDFPATQPIPSLKLPAMAIVLEVKEPAFANELFLAFQNIVAIINLTGIQSGRPQLLLSGETYHGADLRKATYLASYNAPKEKAPKEKASKEKGSKEKAAKEKTAKDADYKARIEYNFTPSAALVGQRFIIGSTSDIVKELIDVASGSPGALSGERNVVLKLDGQQLREAFADNREMLVSRAMLSSGDEREAAAKQVGSLLDLGRLLEGLDLQMLARPESLALEASVTLGSP